jgi:hypothetical protein
MKTIGSDTEVVIFGSIIKGRGVTESTIYRVTVPKDISVKNPVVLYRPFDENLYNALKDGSDEQRIRADLMLAYQKTLNDYIAELKLEESPWKRVDPSFANANIDIERSGSNPFLLII